MEADQGRRLAGIEMADDGAWNLPVEVLKRVGLGMDGGSRCTGPKRAILRFLNNEKDFLHGAVQAHPTPMGRAARNPQAPPLQARSRSLPLTYL